MKGLDKIAQSLDDFHSLAETAKVHDSAVQGYLRDIIAGIQQQNVLLKQVIAYLERGDNRRSQ